VSDCDGIGVTPKTKIYIGAVRMRVLSLEVPAAPEGWTAPEPGPSAISGVPVIISRLFAILIEPLT
jgi:hypothetical protein